MNRANLGIRPTALMVAAALGALGWTAEPTYGQLRSRRGSTGVLNDLGRNTRLVTPVTVQSQALNRSPRGTGGYSTPGLSRNLSGDSQRSSAGPSRAGHDLLSGSRAAGSFSVPFTTQNTYIPLLPARALERFSSDRILDRVQMSSSHVGTLRSRRQELTYAGATSLESIALTPDILLRSHSNTAPVSRAYRDLSISAHVDNSIAAPLRAPTADEHNAAPARLSQLQAERMTAIHDSEIQAGWKWFKEADYLRSSSAFLRTEIAEPTDPNARAGRFCSDIAVQRFDSAATGLRRILKVDKAEAFRLNISLREVWSNEQALREIVVGTENLVLLAPQQVATKALLAYLRWYSGDRSDALRLAREIRVLDAQSDFAVMESLMLEAGAAPKP